MNRISIDKFNAGFFKNSILTDGYCVVENVLNEEQVKLLKPATFNAIEKEKDYHLSSDYKNYGVVQCCPIYGEPFLSLAEEKKLFDPFNLVMGEGSIIYVYITSSMPPHSGNFSTRIHVDRPRVFENYCECLAGLIMLDDFTESNGSTQLLPRSQNQKEVPSEASFKKNALTITGKAGSVLYFNLRLWHTGGKNETNDWRHALAIGVVRPYLKQKFDIPGAIKQHKIDDDFLSDYARQKLGYFAIPPKSLDEFYGNNTERTYREKSEWEIAKKESSDL